MPSRKAGAEALSPSKRAAEPAEETQVIEEGATRKRRKGLGVRVIGGRIYDSENGKTCHQCRQKTVDFMAPCKATSGSRPCTQHFCAKCLFNRYGEKVTEVAQLPSWSCPKCRGDCNCSICLKKKGCVPTGMLVHTAKATGFTSVAELLKKRPAVKADCVETPESLPHKKAQKKESSKDRTVIDKSCNSGEKCGTSITSKPNKIDSTVKKRKLVVTTDGGVEGPVVNALLQKSPPKRGKAPADSMLDAQLPAKEKKAAAEPSSGAPSSKGKKEKSPKGKGTLEGFLHVKPKKKVTFKEASALEPSISNPSDMQVKTEDGQVLSVKQKKAKSVKKSSASALSEDMKPSLIRGNAKASKKGLKENVKVKVAAGSQTIDDEGKLLSKRTSKKEKSSDVGGKLHTLKNPKTDGKEPKKRSTLGKPILPNYEEQIVLPPGQPLVMVAGLDFPSEAIGPAAQLVEFCSAFQSVLELRRGDAEAMLRELTKGRLVRKGPNSLLVQLHAKLLNMIESSFTESTVHVTQFSSGRMSWLNILKKHLSERSCMFLGLSIENEQTDIGLFNKGWGMAAKVMSKDDLKIIKDAVERGAEGYESLEVHHKLQLLVILCDDCLETQEMRDHIESANRGFTEAQRETREEVLAARKEVRDARQKIKDAEVAKFLNSGNLNGPLTTEDQEALLSKVLAETERAVAAASLEREAILRMKKGRSDAVRTDAIAWGPDGQGFYKLKGVDNGNSVVVQECMAAQPALDRWSVYSSEEEGVLTKFLLQRASICRSKMLAEASLEGSCADEEKENRVPNSVKVERVF